MTESKVRKGEFALIERLTGLLSANTADDVLIGIGDDCAVVRRGVHLDVYTTDTMVDGVHFRHGEIPWFDLGWKSIAVNVSDIAAMGAEPLHTLVTLGIPDYVSDEDLEQMYQGMNAITAEFGGSVVGGDIVRASELFITVAAVGTRASGGSDDLPLMLRSKARIGDVIAVTGTLGAPAAGLAAGERGQANEYPALVARHYRPAPRVAEGQAFVEAGIRCGIDISDGLVADLGHVCESSGVAANVDVGKLPVPEELTAAFPDEWLHFALSGGEDYELLITGDTLAIEEAQANTETPITVIGEIVAPTGGRAPVTVVDEAGEAVDVSTGGWDHLRR